MKTEQISVTKNEVKVEFRAEYYEDWTAYSNKWHRNYGPKRTLYGWQLYINGKQDTMPPLHRKPSEKRLQEIANLIAQ